MKSFNKSILALLSIALLGLLSAPAFGATQKFALDPFHTQVRITWNHFGFSNPGATFDINKGTLIWNSDNPSQSSVKVTIPVASVHSQVPVLDKKLKHDFFEADKYPTITFESTNVNRIGKSDHYRIKGKLTLHGVTQPVTLRATLNKIGEHPMLHAPAIGFDATATIQRSEFGMGAYIPMVSDQVTIHITVEAIAPEALAREMKAVTAKGDSN